MPNFQNLYGEPVWLQYRKQDRSGLGDRPPPPKAKVRAPTLNCSPIHSIHRCCPLIYSVYNEDCAISNRGSQRSSFEPGVEQPHLEAREIRSVCLISDLEHIEIVTYYIVSLHQNNNCMLLTRCSYVIPSSAKPVKSPRLMGERPHWNWTTEVKDRGVTSHHT